VTLWLCVVLERHLSVSIDNRRMVLTRQGAFDDAFMPDSLFLGLGSYRVRFR